MPGLLVVVVASVAWLATTGSVREPLSALVIYAATAGTRDVRRIADMRAEIRDAARSAGPVDIGWRWLVAAAGADADRVVVVTRAWTWVGMGVVQGAVRWRVERLDATAGRRVSVG